MASITISFNFSCGDETHSDSVDFETDPSVVSDIDTYADEALDELNADLDDGEDEWEFDEWEVSDWDDNYWNPAEFSDLDAYSEFVANVDEHGEGYRLRHADIGDFDFDDQYQGCWASAEEFVQNLVEDCYNLDVPSFVHIDWERTARDVMMDYSVYETRDGCHIFRD